MLLRTLVLKVSGWRWVEHMVRKSRIFRRIVERFIGGDTLQEALENSMPLLERGFLLSLDLLGESVRDREEAVRAKDQFKEILHSIEGHPRFSKPTDGRMETMNISIKLTQCGLDISDDLASAHLMEVVADAARIGSFVRVDMESSDYTEKTLQMAEAAFATSPFVGTVLQSYLHRTPADLGRLNEAGMRIRLVKGAYLEPESVAFQDKRDVDKAYLELAKKMLAHTNYPAFATHDGALIEQICRHAASIGADRRSFEFQMLYGIRRDLQDRLLNEGYNVRIYVPFGEAWYPYFSRRLAERPANLWFILRAIFKK